MQIIILCDVFVFGNNIISSLRQMCKPDVRSYIPHFRGVLHEKGPALFVELAFVTEIPRISSILLQSLF